MHSNIEKLFQIANKDTRTIIGLMSGTSLDGLDVALCTFSGEGLQTSVQLLHFETIPYSDEVVKEIRTVFSKSIIELQQLCLLNGWLGSIHAEMVNNCMAKWNIPNNQIDLIASHGQTIYHAPKRLHNKEPFGNGTLQIGDGDHIAVKTGIITVSDFRQKHIALGGEGAPLAIYGDYLLFCHLKENRILLNIGGIANLTYLPANASFEDIISTDVGAGNTLMDAYIRKHFIGKYYDKDASVAVQGKVILPLLEALKKLSFFEEAFPKTTGPELFGMDYLEKAIANASIDFYSDEDILSTLNQLSADMIVVAINKLVMNVENVMVYVSGGGVHNPLLMQRIKDQLPEGIAVQNLHALGVNPDAKEAILFALLANEAVAGKGWGDKLDRSISLGKISFPG